jgi:hypothetical protein
MAVQVRKPPSAGISDADSALSARFCRGFPLPRPPPGCHPACSFPAGAPFRPHPSFTACVPVLSPRIPLPRRSAAFARGPRPAHPLREGPARRPPVRAGTGVYGCGDWAGSACRERCGGLPGDGSGRPSRSVRTAGDLWRESGGLMPVSSLLCQGLAPYVSEVSRNVRRFPAGGH